MRRAALRRHNQEESTSYCTLRTTKATMTTTSNDLIASNQLINQSVQGSIASSATPNQQVTVVNASDFIL
jgi:hypothetical protein